MAFRINKVIGYGVQLDLDDDRFVPEVFSGPHGSELYEIRDDEWKQFLEENWDDMRNLSDERFLLSAMRGRVCESINQYIHYDGETGIKGLIVFRPHGMEDWYRRNNIMDWAECHLSTLCDDACGPRVEWLNGGIHPWHWSVDGHPVVPISIKAAVIFISHKWPSMIPDPKHLIETLRPVSYVYWS